MHIKLDELFYEQDDVQIIKELAARKIEIHQQSYEMIEKPIQLELNFHKANEKEVYLQGRIAFAWRLICDRCMAEVEQAMDIPFDRDILLQEDGYVLDMDELIREEAILNFPQKTLCDEECLGICPDCGKNRNEEACTCRTAEVKDLRFAGLKELFENNFKEV